MCVEIRSYIAAGEGTRATKLATAIADDPRFALLEVNTEIPLDVQFSIDNSKTTFDNADGLLEELARPDVFNIELKEPADYIQSALGRDGHLYMQLLAAREAGHPCMVVVLGGDNQITESIIDALKTRYRGKDLGLNISSYESRLIDFEANCEALGCPVRRWQAAPWKRMLSTANKILTGGDLMGYRPRPADGEREITAASCLFKGIGPELMRTLLEEYQVGFVPRGECARPIESLPGWGKKRVAQVAPYIRMGV